MAPHKTQINCFSPCRPSLDCGLKFTKNATTCYSKTVLDIIQWTWVRDIETLWLLGVLKNHQAWEEFKKSSSFRKEKFTLLLSTYLKIQLWFSID